MLSANFRSTANSRKLSQLLADLFAKMAKGGFFGSEEILHFNGGLFADAEVIDLDTAEMANLVESAKHDWSNVESSIFGTLFERILNPDKRSQLGAHYTGKDDILTLLRPVMEAPLRREWGAVKVEIEKQALVAECPAKVKKRIASSRPICTVACRMPSGLYGLSRRASAVTVQPGHVGWFVSEVLVPLTFFSGIISGLPISRLVKPNTLSAGHMSEQYLQECQRV